MGGECSYVLRLKDMESKILAVVMLFRPELSI